jgi:hypothetical protein
MKISAGQLLYRLWSQKSLSISISPLACKHRKTLTNIRDKEDQIKDVLVTRKKSAFLQIVCGFGKLICQSQRRIATEHPVIN